MTYLFVAYAVFWAVTFALVLSIFARQRASERELSTLRALLDRYAESSDGDAWNANETGRRD